MKLTNRDQGFTFDYIPNPAKDKLKSFLDTVKSNPAHADHRDLFFIYFKVTTVIFQVFTSLETAVQVRLEV